jgi:hypothetical protein
MSLHGCCGVAASHLGHRTTVVRAMRGNRRPLTFARRCLAIAGWLASGAILALLPKCPACLAAYVALGTGAGLSLSATHLQTLLVILCVVALSYLTARRMRRFSAVIFVPKGTVQ